MMMKINKYQTTENIGDVFFISKNNLNMLRAFPMMMSIKKFREKLKPIYQEFVAEGEKLRLERKNQHDQGKHEPRK